VGDESEGNIISSNGWVGILVLGNATNTRIAGNKIGTDITGTVSLGNSSTGIAISASTGTIIGTNGDGQSDAIESNLISGNQAQGIDADSANAKTLVIAGNLIGTTANGLSKLANTGHGISFSSVFNAVIGGALPAQRNIISGNNGAGIFTMSSQGNTITNNVIGLDKDAAAPIKNNTSGIQFENYSSGNTIDKNIVSGNTKGILIKNSGYSVVTGNIVGMAGDGTTAQGNTDYGIGLVGGSCDFNRIGTNGDGVNDAAERNIVAGNGVYNLYLDFAFDTTIAGNYIGLKANGTSGFANSATTAGIFINNSTRTTIGTNGSNDAFNEAERNYISGNTGTAISIVGSDPAMPYITQDTIIAGNVIGLTVAGNELANGGDGIRMATNTIRTRIGTNANGISDDLERNVISGNAGNGISADSAGVKDLVIAGNYIGTSISGTARAANASSGIVFTSVSNGLIGGALLAQRNIISGNNGDSGIQLSESNGTTVRNNFIGLNANGDAQIGNANYGIRNHFSNNSLITGNNISGNGVGMLLYSSNDVSITGNYIGLAPDGVNSIPNTYGGITAQECLRLYVGTRGLDASTANGNFIAGNGYQQIRLDFGAQNVIAGNSIGVGVNGQSVIGGITGGSIAPLGILSVSSTDLRIGTNGSTDAFNATEANVIGGLARDGIHLTGTLSAPDLRTVIAGNYIGVTPGGENRSNQ
ncbi:MAG: beta strand repeat-containing protein, partial [Pirellula sp.]